MGSVENTRQKMNQIILVVAFLGSAVLCEEVVRKPKLFFVSTSATTSTLQTASVCYLSSSTLATCSGRKRRTISLDGMEPAGAVQPSTFNHHEVYPNLYFGSDPSFFFLISLYIFNKIQICTSANPILFLLIPNLYFGSNPSF